MTFFRNSRLKPILLIILFGLRAASGCLHNWIAFKYYPYHGDIWGFFQASFVTRHELFHDFQGFIADNSSWDSMPHNFIECMHILLNFLSFDNLWINTLLFSFLAFWGNIALFKVFNALFKNDIMCCLSVLVLPSTLFWTSCIHTEGILYMLLGFFLYYLYRGAGESISSPGSWNLRSLLRSLFFFGLMVFFRSAIAISLLPAIGFWMLAARTNRFSTTSSFINAPRSYIRSFSLRAYFSSLSQRPYFKMTAITLSIIILALAIPTVSGKFLHSLSDRQQEFQALTGNSRIPLPKLNPTWNSFLTVLPTAAGNGFLQPLPGGGGQLIYTVFSIELILIWGTLAWALIVLFIRKDPDPPSLSSPSTFSSPPSPSASSTPSASPSPSTQSSLSPPIPSPTTKAPSLIFRSLDLPVPAITGCLLFALSGMLLIGFVVPFAGAIVRYRCLFLPFLLAPAIHILVSNGVIYRLNNWLRQNLLTGNQSNPLPANAK